MAYDNNISHPLHLAANPVSLQLAKDLLIFKSNADWKSLNHTRKWVWGRNERRLREQEERVKNGLILSRAFPHLYASYLSHRGDPLPLGTLFLKPRMGGLFEYVLATDCKSNEPLNL